MVESCRCLKEPIDLANGFVPHLPDLEVLAIRRFGAHLKESEKRLLRNAPRGEIVSCGPNLNDQDQRNDPSKSDNWDASREIRAELLTWLCIDQVASKIVDSRGLVVHAAKITGKLALSYSTVPFPFLMFKCRLTDEADLTFIKIPHLYLNGSKTKSLFAEGAVINGNLLLQGVSVDGEVRLTGAQIDGTVNCEGSTFSNPPKSGDFRREENRGKAIRADRIIVKGGIFLRNGFKADGEVMLNGAGIGGDLSCRGGSFRNINGGALSAEKATVGGNVFLYDGFSAYGTIDFVGAKIGGSINCRGGTFDRVLLETVVVKGMFVWSEVQNPNSAQLDLRGATAGSVADDEKSWPARGNLHLDGFEYGRISGSPSDDAFGEVAEEESSEIQKRLGGRLVEDSPTDARSRLKWLDRDAVFKPQPYRQLAKVLQQTGDEEGAKQVLFEMENRVRAQARRSLILPNRLLQWVFDNGYKGTVGYGLYPLRAVWELGMLWGLGFVLFRRARVMAPTDKEAYSSFRESGELPKHYPRFSAPIYSLENCVPLVKFGQDDHWQPDPNPQSFVSAAVPTTDLWMRLRTRYLRLRTSPRWLCSARWFMIALGWVLATFFVAGLASMIKAK